VINNTMLNNKSLEIKIGKLWNSSEGSTEKMELDMPVKFEGNELKAASNFVADLMLIKLKDEISAIITDAHIVLHANCEKCLTKFDYEVIIPTVGREFVAKKDTETDLFETFNIDLNKMTIDLTDMIRQEIILHFPLISLCSKSCKGLCDICGKDKNATNCECEEKRGDLATQKPFKNLKSLMAKPSKRTKKVNKKHNG
jgi:uncharacterized protein